MSSEKIKACKCKNVKGWELEGANAMETRKFFGVVPIGGAIIHPCRLQPTKGNGCVGPLRAPSTKDPRRSNLVYPSMAIVHEGLASLR